MRMTTCNGCGGKGFWGGACAVCKGYGFLICREGDSGFHPVSLVGFDTYAEERRVPRFTSADDAGLDAIREAVKMGTGEVSVDEELFAQVDEFKNAKPPPEPTPHYLSLRLDAQQQMISCLREEIEKLKDSKVDAVHFKSFRDAGGILPEDFRSLARRMRDLEEMLINAGDILSGRTTNAI